MQVDELVHSLAACRVEEEESFTTKADEGIGAAATAAWQ